MKIKLKNSNLEFVSKILYSKEFSESELRSGSVGNIANSNATRTVVFDVRNISEIKFVTSNSEIEKIDYLFWTSESAIGKFVTEGSPEGEIFESTGSHITKVNTFITIPDGIKGMSISVLTPKATTLEYKNEINYYKKTL